MGLASSFGWSHMAEYSELGRIIHLYNEGWQIFVSHEYHSTCGIKLQAWQDFSALQVTNISHKNTEAIGPHSSPDSLHDTTFIVYLQIYQSWADVNYCIKSTCLFLQLIHNWPDLTSLHLSGKPSDNLIWSCDIWEADLCTRKLQGEEKHTFRWQTPNRSL